MSRGWCWLVGAMLAVAGLGQIDDPGDFELEEREPMTEAQAVERVKAALAVGDPATRAVALLKLLDDLQAHPEVILPPRDDLRFREALANEAPAEALRQRAARLLAGAAEAEAGPAGTLRLNLGLQLAAAAGGADLATLTAIHRRRADADRQWLLPALGRVGGPAALPLIQPHRDDALITPLNHPTNLRPVACAAALGAAYAGEPKAIDLVLQWYEEDARDRPRFAWYVQWAIQEGMPPDYRMLDYCTQRYHMAERYLDSLPPTALPTLIARANERLAIALTDYLLRRLQSIPPADLPLFLPMLANPAQAVKAPVLRALLARGEPALQLQALDRLTAHLASSQAVERHAAAVLLLRHAPELARPQLRELAERDPSPELRYRLRALLNVGRAPPE